MVHSGSLNRLNNFRMKREKKRKANEGHTLFNVLYNYCIELHNDFVQSTKQVNV